MVTKFTSWEVYLGQRGGGIQSASRRTPWEDRYQELVSFKEEHGHLMVPPESKLGVWVKNQRTFFQYGTLALDRIAKLEILGFFFRPPHVFDTRWNQNYALLEAFQKEHGHTNVTPGNALHKWASKQRFHARNGNLPQDRVAKLEALGFVFAIYKKAA
jgi:hypothetical protein